MIDSFKWNMGIIDFPILNDMEDKNFTFLLNLWTLELCSPVLFLFFSNKV